MSSSASDGSPFRDGFAAVWHDPVLLVAELAWRWCFGFSAWALFVISGALFLDSLKVSPLDELLFGTLQPQLLFGALHHILHGSLTRLVLEQSALLLGLTLLWCFAATVGRAATLRRLVAMFSADDGPISMTWQFASIFVLSLMRAAWSWIAMSVAIACLLIGGVMAAQDRAGWAALFLAFGIGLPCWFGAVLNWFFGLAPLFCIRSGAQVMDALGQSVDFVSRRGGRLSLLGLFFLLLRLVWFATMMLAILSSLSMVQLVPIGWVLVLMAAVALIYFAGADLLYLARLGAYVSLAEDDARPVPVPEASSPPDPEIAAEPVPPSEIAPTVNVS